VTETPRPGRSVRGSTSGRPIMAALDLFGRRWTLRILWELRGGPLGFRPLQQRCDNMSSSVLHARLAELRHARLIQHQPGGSYELTPLGQDAETAIRPLLAWSKRWAAELDDIPPLAPEDHECPTCQMSYAATTLNAALACVRSYPARYRQALDSLADQVLRQRPEPRTWSVLEYACHVRDVYDVYHTRLTRTMTGERPVLEPMRNEQRAARDDYNQQDPRHVLDVLAEQAARFVALAQAVTPAQYTLTATRLPGEERTLLWLVRQAAHEGLHHLHDIERIRVTLTGTEAPASP
jgi:DNA-binding HxlR family transcriptional regulator